MNASTEIVLLAMFYLLTKHMVADFFLQSGTMVCNKGRYGHPAGLLHAGIHAGLTVPVFYFLPPSSLTLGVVVVFTEFFAHYHIDWMKDRVSKVKGWTPTQRLFWIAFGFDQYLQLVTYLAIVWFLVART